ncbi:endonuclease/exonuclease/phosphatase family protein [Hydrogenimonas sp.]
MRPHRKPRFDYRFDLEEEIARLREHRALPSRAIPQRRDDNILIATWNLTNFGLQKRQEEHLRLMAEIMKPFDIVAVQEVADDLEQFERLHAHLEGEWRYLFTDIAGNNERLGYLYRKDRVRPTGLAAELAMRGYERRSIVIEGMEPEEAPFTGFNRNPYMVGFQSGDFAFSIVNVHLYWSNIALRRLETKALAKWAKSRIRRAGPPNNDIILIGDFNMPHVRPGDPIYDELAEYGLSLPKHTTNLVGTNLAGDSDYDQIAFFPSRTDEDFAGRMGVFDFDNALFKELWALSTGRRKKHFFQYMRYYIADHRLLWAEFKR